MQEQVETDKTPAFVSNDKRSRDLWNYTRQVYTLRQFRPAFISDGRPTSDVDTVLRTLANAGNEGLKPEDFAVNADVIQKNDDELQLTYSLTRYVSQLCFGRIDPKELDADWPPTQKACDIPKLVNDALEQGSVEKLADQLSPRIPEYQGLRTALQRYREIANAGGWQTHPLPPKGKKQVINAAVLAPHLTATGDLAGSNNEQSVSEAAVKEALRKFQTRHGLEASGVPDAKTIAALNIPVDQRIAQIEINMDRMRWIGERFEPHHIRVNIPEFHLSVHENEQVPLEMRVIVGSRENTTPILDGRMEYLVFSPYWNIPLSIATKELVPKIRKDPNFLRKEEMEVVRVSGDKVQTVDPSKIDWDAIGEGSEYQLRQRPGSQNALGLVKFIFPNRYNVYLHDTPGDNLFDRLTRTLSHGCIRVEKPSELAAYVLRDQPEWTFERIEEAMHAEKEKRVSLKTAIPVHLLYWTAWADADGTVNFREDVYGYDEIQRGLTSSPATNASDIDVNKVRAGVVPDAAGLH
jgi:murein L,D-transpeptidase YcbB/YkuD